MDNTPDSSILSRCPEIKAAPAITIALSGGMDSVVLLHLSQQAHRAGNIRCIKAIHVNHGLSPRSDAWAKYCQSLCEQWNIPLHLEKAVLQYTSRKGTEQIAREARYQIFTQQINEGECLLQGHHRDDQAETVLFRALRGADIHGLQSIPQQRCLGRGFLFRPLIFHSRRDIESYAAKHGLTWIEDDSNLNTHYDRNFIRHQVLPVIRKRWPDASRALTEVTHHCKATQKLLDEVAETDLRQVMQHIQLPILGQTSALHCPALQSLSHERLLNVYKYWLRSENVVIPGKHSLEKGLNTLLYANADRTPCLQSHQVEIYRYRHWLIINRLTDDFLSDEKPIMLAEGDIELKDNGCLQTHLSRGTECIVPDTKDIRLTYRDNLSALPTFSVHGRPERKSLKKWLNELKVPVWLRHRLPVLATPTQLVAIPGLLTNALFAAKPNESGWKVHWRLPD